MRYRAIIFLIAWALPALLRADCLTSVRSSYHARENFAIVVLQFDREVAYRVREGSSGTSARITLPGCRIEPQAARVLTEVAKRTGKLIRSIQIDSSGASRSSDGDDSVVGGPAIDLLFPGKTRLLLRESSQPFSLILDISPAPKGGSAPVKEKASEKTLPARNEKSTPPKPQLKSPLKADSVKVKEETDWLENGRKALAKKQTREAFNAFEKAALQYPDSLEAHYQMGLILKQWGQLDSALDHLQKARQDSRLFKPATTQIAAIYRQQGRSAEEIAEWEKILTKLKDEGVAPAEPPEDVIAIERGSEESAEISAQNGSAVYARRGGISPVQYGLWAIVVVLSIVIAVIYRRQREFQRTIRALLDTGEPEAPPAEEAAEEPASSKDVALDVKDVVGSPSQPKNRPSEETTRQVFDLNSAGLSIHDIAEKLNLGQDEVRLILNLKREEAVPASPVT